MSERHWTPVPEAPGAPPPAGAYSPAVHVGNLIFVSGQVPKDPDTGRVEGDVRDQTRRVLANAARVLEAAGATLDNVVSVTAYLADIGDWAAFNEVYAATFSAPYPSRTTVGAGLHGFLVEISLIAVAGHARSSG